LTADSFVGKMMSNSVNFDLFLHMVLAYVASNISARNITPTTTLCV
jgi:hypothetical protein